MPFADARPRPRVCLVTPGYISSTPRVVREADALHAAGYDVRVVFAQGALDEVRAFDDELVTTRPWRHAALRWSDRRSSERRVFFLSGLRHRIARRIADVGVAPPWLADSAEGRLYPELSAVASQERADIYIGHYPTGLAAAHRAAALHGAALGYDIEDLYAEIFAPAPETEGDRRRIQSLERRYAPLCDHLSAVSLAVAEEFAERYKTRVPLVVHNCHPWADRAHLDGRTIDRRGPALSLFWFSQTVGLDRGLQDAIRAAGLLKVKSQLHIRGHVSDEVRRELSALAAAQGVGDCVHFHPRCAPAELLSRASEHDVGLALETDDALSRRLSITNKLFLYLTAGLAVAATDLPGQRQIAQRVPAAAAVYRLGDTASLAAVLERWARDAEALAAAKRAALEAARVRWNAETEGRTIVDAVDRVLERGIRSVRAGTA